MIVNPEMGKPDTSGPRPSPFPDRDPEVEEQLRRMKTGTANLTPFVGFLTGTENNNDSDTSSSSSSSSSSSNSNSNQNAAGGPRVQTGKGGRAFDPTKQEPESGFLSLKRMNDLANDPTMDFTEKLKKRPPPPSSPSASSTSSGSQDEEKS